jgi:tetratricopeptide (TPR) repeat protein
VPVDADHISIVKPLHRFSVLYARTRDFIAKSNPVPETQEGGLEIYPLPPIQPEQPLNVLPKLMRIAAIGLVALIGYKGVQALIAPPPTEQLAAQIAALNAQNADLTKLLLGRNPSAAGPGAQQAVGGAVQSIAQGASEGDKRLQQALDLLKDNKVAEATQLLTAVSEDKAAHAEKDRKVAAIAYRNLGAIAGLRDPKSALEAYEKAASLDPGDIDSLIWAGWIEIYHGDLDKAQTRLERVGRR